MTKFLYFTLKIFASLRLCVLALIFFSFSYAQTLAPGAPGKDAQWATAGKQAVGTSASLGSKVWFTLAQGALTEVYYPDVTVANVHLLQFVVVDPKTRKVETEQADAVHQIKVLRPDSPTFQQINTAKSGAWKITKTYATDPKKNTVLIDVKFEPVNKDLNLYVYYDPSLGNSGLHDWAQSPALMGEIEREWTDFDGKRTYRKEVLNRGIIAEDEAVEENRIASALLFSSNISELTNGFYGVSDGLEQLRAFGKIPTRYVAKKGNAVQMAKIDAPSHFTVALGFANDRYNLINALGNADESLRKGFAKCLEEYEKEWADYVKTIRRVDPKYQAQFNMAAMQLKAHEDKTVRGANIASLSVPWGGGENANENNIGGYHLIWSRDLYQVATAFMALGDRDAAVRALNFLFKVQQKADGSFPQNSYLDGKPFWGSLQLDEVAYPLILAHELGLHDRETYEKHVKRAADFIVKNGPQTPQERWEEEAGYSPSTIAAEIAGLVCAAEIARKNGDEASAVIYTATADDWARKVEMWTATTNGKYGDGNYYVRISQNGKPDAGEKIELNNGAGFFDEREIVDAGFLELVRLGIKPANDPLIAKSVKVIDEVIRVNTPHGAGFYRYNHDGYGEMDDGRRWNWDGKYTGKGRLWALLSGERGQYELALSNYYRENPERPAPRILNWMRYQNAARSRLDTMNGFANEGLMIPEQIWDRKETPNADRQFVPELKFGEGTGSATPLAWSMAQFIRLAVNLREEKNLDTPAVVYNRYVKGGLPGQASGFGGLDQTAILPVKAGEKFTVTRRAAPHSKIAVSFRGETRLFKIDEKGEFKAEVVAPDKEEIGIIAIETPDGATAFERVKVRAADKLERQEFSAGTIEKIKNAKSSPLVDNGKAILFYRGAAKSVMVAGDITDWSPGRIFMREIADDIHAVELKFAPTARTEYKFIVDGRWITDELNPNRMDNGVGGENSILTMPGYKPTEWDQENKQPVGKIEELKIQSKIYGERIVKVYQPGLNSKAKVFLPTLYFQDGTEYINRTKAVEIQQNLVKAGKIKPFIMVFLDPKDRMKEYWASDEYARFVATEVVPAVDAKYNTIKNREGRGIIGASLGGVTSVWVGLKYPGVFSRVGGQSSSFWIDNERVVKELSRLDAGQTKFRFYFDDGAFEGAEDSRRVYVMLRGKGYPINLVEGETGHNWTSWRDRLADAFVAFMN